MKVVVVGMGYVGLPLAILCAKKGHDVVGITIDDEAIKLINSKRSPIKDEALEKSLKEVDLTATSDYSRAKEAEVILICVPTPVNDDHTPDLSYISSAAESISSNMADGQLIILESTVYPGTTEEIVKPILEKSGLKAGEGFYLAHCPERIDPGNTTWTVENIPRVVGAFSDKGREKAVEFYRTIVNADIVGLSTLKAAEATKIMENSFRDINIAFMNEMAMSFHKAGIDILDVIRGASTKPFGFLPHYPGCGVGGHCIPVDPYYLIDKAKNIGFDHRFLKLARNINEGMPGYTVELLERSLNESRKKLKDVTIGVYGLAYKAGIDDVRESPGMVIEGILKKKGVSTIVYDPFVKDEGNPASLAEFLDKIDALIIATDHSEIKRLDPKSFRQKGVLFIVDGRNSLDSKLIVSQGINYKGIGR